MRYRQSPSSCNRYQTGGSSVFVSPPLTMKLKFEGLMAPVFTAFHRDSSRCRVDLSFISSYVQHLEENGIKGVLVNGTSGEGMSLTLSERKDTAEAWIAAGKPRGLHVQVQVGGTNFVDVCELAKHAEQKGADSLLCLPELFNKPASVEDLVVYLESVAAAAPSTPLLYYHNPSYTAVHVDVPTLMLQAKGAIPTFAGVKYTDTNLEVGVKCLSVDSSLTVFLGCDYVLAGAFALGFSSAIATSVNVLPRLCGRILDAVRQGDVRGARGAQDTLNAAAGIITKHGKWVTGMKAAMHLFSGLDMGPVRRPLNAFPEEHLPSMREELVKLQLL